LDLVLDTGKVIKLTESMIISLLVFISLDQLKISMSQ